MMMVTACKLVRQSDLDDNLRFRALTQVYHAAFSGPMTEQQIIDGAQVVGGVGNDRLPAKHTLVQGIPVVGHRCRKLSAGLARIVMTASTAGYYGSPGGAGFDYRLRTGTQTRRIPLLIPFVQYSSDSGYSLRYIRSTRQTATRVYEKVIGADQAGLAINAFETHQGKMFRFQVSPNEVRRFLFVRGSLTPLPEGPVLASVMFETTGRVRAFPAGTFGNDVDVPALDVLDEYATDKGDNQFPPTPFPVPEVRVWKALDHYILYNSTMQPFFWITLPLADPIGASASIPGEVNYEPY